jgi:hypothetical protein
MASGEDPIGPERQRGRLDARKLGSLTKRRRTVQ